MENERKNVLTAREIVELNPRRREAHSSNIVKRILKENPEGLTISQVSDKTNLSYNTSVKHLELLVARREARKEYRKEPRQMGDMKVAIYFPIGDLGKGEMVHCTVGAYRLARLENETGKYIYVKEIAYDELRNEQVRGVLMIRFEDFLDFSKKLNTFANKVINSEPKA